MSTTKPKAEQSPWAIFTELAVEGTSSLVEVQRTILDLAQKQNDFILKGVKERVGGYFPAAAVAEVVKQGVDTIIGVQQELLTLTSKQTLQWLDPEAPKADRAAQVVDFAREGVETFTRAQKKFIEALAKQATKVASGKTGQIDETEKKTDLRELAREAGNAFIEAQKRLLDVFGQQINVNLDATSRAAELISPTQLQPLADLTGKSVKDFFAGETSFLGSLITPRKKIAAKPKARRARKVQPKAAAV